MASTSYTVRVAYSAMPASAVRNRRMRKPSGAAIRGMLMGAPIAALLWAPIIWGVSKLI